MNALSDTTLELLRSALHAQSSSTGRNAELGIAMARARGEVGRVPVRASELMEMLRTLIAEVPAVKFAEGASARASEVQRIVEACLAAYYGET